MAWITFDDRCLFILVLRIIILFFIITICDVALEMYFSPTVLSFSSVYVYTNCIYNLVMDKYYSIRHIYVR